MVTPETPKLRVVNTSPPSRSVRFFARRRGCSRRWLGIAAGVLLVLAAGWAGWLAVQTGPRYDGQTLSRQLALATGPDARQRAQARMVLNQVGPEAVPQLIRAVEAREPRWRTVWQALRSRLLRQPLPPGRFRDINTLAAELLARLGPAASNAVPALLRWGLRNDREPYSETARYLAAIGPAAAPHLLAALQQPDVRVRRLALMTLRDPRFSPAAETLNPALLELLGGPDPEACRGAILALASLNPDRPEMAERFAALLPGSDSLTAVYLLNGLRHLGPVARPVAARIEPWLHAADPQLRLAAAGALWAARPPALEILPVLIQILRDTLPGDAATTGAASPGLQWNALQILYGMGPAAAPAVPELLALLERAPTHRPSRTPHAAALALSRIGPAAVDGVVKLLEHSSAEVRMNAAAALGNPGAAAAPAVPRLIAMLASEDPEEQMAAANALGRLGAVAADALPALQRLGAVETTQDVLVGHARSAARSAMAQIHRAMQTAATGPDPPR